VSENDDAGQVEQVGNVDVPVDQFVDWRGVGVVVEASKAVLFLKVGGAQGTVSEWYTELTVTSQNLVFRVRSYKEQL
jgi:hypothetical protein